MNAAILAMIAIALTVPIVSEIKEIEDAITKYLPVPKPPEIQERTETGETVEETAEETPEKRELKRTRELREGQRVRGEVVGKSVSGRRAVIYVRPLQHSAREVYRVEVPRSAAREVRRGTVVEVRRTERGTVVRPSTPTTTTARAGRGGGTAPSGRAGPAGTTHTVTHGAPSGGGGSVAGGGRTVAPSVGGSAASTELQKAPPSRPSPPASPSVTGRPSGGAATGGGGAGTAGKGGGHGGGAGKGGGKKGGGKPKPAGGPGGKQGGPASSAFTRESPSTGGGWWPYVVAVVLLGAVVGWVWAVRRRRRFYREFELEI